MQEAEKQYGITYDKVWSEYGRRGSQLKDFETKLSQAQSELEAFRQKKDAGVETPADEARASQARDLIKNMGFTQKEDLEKEGYIRKDDLPQYFKSWQNEFVTNFGKGSGQMSQMHEFPVLCILVGSIHW